MKKIISLKIFIALIFFLNLNRCTKNNDQIDYSNVEGYYQYILIDHSNKTIIDTIRTYVNILGKINDSDSLKLHISLLPKNNFIGTINNYLEIRNLKFWGNKFTYEANRYYSTTLKKNEIWDVRDSSFSTTEKPYISFKCLSTDTTLIYPSGRKISNIRMVLKKVRHQGVSEIIGFNSKHQIVYFSNFYFNTEYNYLLLDKFIPDSIEDSTKTIEWLKINKSLPIIDDPEILDSDLEYIN